jgi:hypothetical protein
VRQQLRNRETFMTALQGDKSGQTLMIVEDQALIAITL